MLFAGAAIAKNDNHQGNDDHHGKHEKHHKHSKHSKKRHDDYDKASYQSNVVIIHNYIDNYYKKKCPPGLAKKHGCKPIVHAKRYVIGQPLENVIYEPLPREIEVQLRPVAGYRYVQVDQDVLLMSEATKKIVDAITLLSAVE
jgi:Ni/Co efflux regulator RcnB